MAAHKTSHKTSHKTTHQATVHERVTVDNATETVAAEESNRVSTGLRKGALAAKQAASSIASAPGKIWDSTVYGACYGLSYGTVFSALMVAKMLPTDSLILKGFHEGAEVARKDFKTHEQERAAAEEQEPIHGTAERVEAES